MFTENQEMQTLIDGELSDLELEGVTGGSSHFKFKGHHRRRRRRFRGRHHR
ncbi:MAG: hypothetical protein KME17_05770 [Cyanosarcina radialis HA8281-LM2]|jgi:hypothetical protein|nr:hypothetical protein [Cyanosarcina radialis HA8281-LM2]MBW4618851.1 hypothetical protein [Cyanosarcina radialis HA8281-LM2]